MTDHFTASAQHSFPVKQIILSFLSTPFEVKEECLMCVHGDHVHMPACLTICDLVSVTKPTVRFIKFGIEVLYKKLSLKLEFYANHLNDSHTVLKHINEFLPMFSIFLD